MLDFVLNSVVFTVACVFLDRLRGKDTFLPAAATKVTYGLIAMMFLGYHAGAPEVVSVLAAGLFALGSAPGWGAPVGAALDSRNMYAPYERWQFGFLQKNVPVSLVVRGFIWGAPVALVAWINPIFLAPVVIMPVTFSVAPYCVRWLPWELRWASMEYVRGGLTGALLAVSVYLVG